MSANGPLLNLPGFAPAPQIARLQGERELVDKVCAWIEGHLQEEIGWDRLSRISGMPASRLQELFQRHLKTTPMMYIRHRRTRPADPAERTPLPPVTRRNPP